MAKQIFVNLPIKDINKSKEFFTKLGFEFNPQFSNENALCLIIGENIYAMLLVESFFKGFIPGKKIVEASTNTEVLVAISAESREEVDKIIRYVESAGGSEYRKVQDYGWMYGRAFQDLDGHIWEIIFTDETKMSEEMKKKREKQNER
jgi:uncharacterized protein